MRGRIAGSQARVSRGQDRIHLVETGGSVEFVSRRANCHATDRGATTPQWRIRSKSGGTGRTPAVAGSGRLGTLGHRVQAPVEALSGSCWHAQLGRQGEHAPPERLERHPVRQRRGADDDVLRRYARKQLAPHELAKPPLDAVAGDRVLAEAGNHDCHARM